MKFTPQFFKGFGIALAINMMVLLLIYLFFERAGSFAFFLESSWELKTLVAYLSIASIPNIILFSNRIQLPNTDFAQGIMTELIIIVIFIAILKFLI